MKTASIMMNSSACAATEDPFMLRISGMQMTVAIAGRGETDGRI